MRTLLITSDFPPIISGISTYLYNMWRLLPRDDHIVLAAKAEGYEHVDEKSGLTVIRYRDFRSRLVRIAVLLPRILALIPRERIDILVCAVPLSMGFIGLVFKKILNMPYCVFYYGGELKKYRNKKYLARLMKLVLMNADLVIPISEFAQREVISIGIKPEKTVTITPGLDTDRFSPRVDPSAVRKRFDLDDKKVILTVSRLVRRKGIDVVISALPKILKDVPNAVYIIVGCGSEESSLKKSVREKALSKNIIFTGGISEEELPEYYASCDLYVMPNRETDSDETFEGFGISFIEASACGKPVIGGMSGGAAEAVEDGVTGLLVVPEDEDAVASAAIRILKDEAYASRLGRNGSDRIKREFTCLSRAAILEEVLRKVFFKDDK